MNLLDRCDRCGGDCAFIPSCRVCGGCETVACPDHNTPEPIGGPIWIGSEYDDVDYWDDEL